MTHITWTPSTINPRVIIGNVDETFRWCTICEYNDGWLWSPKMKFALRTTIKSIGNRDFGADYDTLDEAQAAATRLLSQLTYILTKGLT